MEKQQPTDIAKFPAIDQQASHIAYAKTHYDHDLDDAYSIAARLPSILQTSLELNDVLKLFNGEMNKAMPYNSFNYQNSDIEYEFNYGTQKHHSCHYRLDMNSAYLGELTLTRNNKFTSEEIGIIEDLLCKLIYPLRNCLLYRQSQTAALEDQLTGLHNRSSFNANLKREMGIAERHKTPFSLIIIDIDNFKEVNDSYGHIAGDIALKSLADVITNNMRTSDIACRFGGEEFTLILNDTSCDEACLIAERIRAAIATTSCSNHKDAFNFTISLGVSEFNLGENSDSLFDRADKALYKAKTSGRNQTICAHHPVNKSN